MIFTPAESEACRRLLELALQEDLGDAGDITSRSTIPEDSKGRAVFVARSAGVVSGLPAAQLTCETIDGSLQFGTQVRDGTNVTAGQQIATVAGPMRSILTAERTALNFLQHLSGVATLTRRFVDAIAGCKGQILDTRKTLPGWRVLDKYAVRCGGGHNHRMGLHDGVLIKDNHLASLRAQGDPISQAVKAARDFVTFVTIEIEVDSLDMLREALACKPDIVLLDNMTPDQMHEAVKLRDQTAPEVKLEASGGIQLATVRAIADTGVDRISIGALTHSAPALDIALDYGE
ncbi:MAG: carboxylating nicotinate-nucleotide diphosphorylase [Gemmataceae bacterium]|nr:carboxylating nicotinate-nucleotide diphosphorylase [Gemmataceae bacterium]